MIQILPTIEYEAVCPGCCKTVQPFTVLWQGLHTCGVCECPNCRILFIEDFRMMFSDKAPFQVNLSTGKLIQLFGSENYKSWFGDQLLYSLSSPQASPSLELKVQKFGNKKKYVIVNCLDFLYGHSLIKLFDAEYYLDTMGDLGVIVIIPEVLQWMVPDGVCEIWTVNIPLSGMRSYYPELNKKIINECQRFDRLYLSRGIHQPQFINITRYTGVPKHDFSRNDFRITFIWRSDRVWCPETSDLVQLPEMRQRSLATQNANICDLFGRLKAKFPQALFTVAGLGCETTFPAWIDDCRVERFTPELERKTCAVYAESRLVIGVHGSNMLLPSAHAGMTIDLLPDSRWDNLADDIIYQDIAVRNVVHKYLHLPIGISAGLLATIAVARILYLDIREIVF